VSATVVVPCGVASDVPWEVLGDVVVFSEDEATEVLPVGVFELAGGL
jgi:hypothetical protein